MCGLVGMLFNGQNGCMSIDADIVQNLLYMDALRGEDSTGVAALFNNGDLQVIKDACDANFFLYTNEWVQMRKDLIAKGKVVLGHNRKKTVGKIDEKTAHPFIINNRFAFMHNGTLTSHKHLADTEVDSEALGIHLTKCEGDSKAIEEALGTVYGAYACVWVDQEKEAVYMLRNQERPLFVARTTAGIVYASEYGMLVAALLRNRLKADDIESLDADTLYTFDVSKAGVGITKEKLTVKKSMPRTFTHTKGSKATTCTGPKESSSLLHSVFPGGASKNAYKRFRKAYMGRIIPFYLDDWVERHYPVMDDDWLVFGNSDNIEAKHLISGYLEGVTKYCLEEDYMQKLCYGKITNVEYDEKSHCIRILVDDIKLYNSVLGKKTNEDSAVKH